jgi:hypothetical protein
MSSPGSPLAFTALEDTLEIWVMEPTAALQQIRAIARIAKVRILHSISDSFGTLLINLPVMEIGLTEQTVDAQSKFWSFPPKYGTRSQVPVLH